MREEINILLNVPSTDVLNEITEMINEKKPTCIKRLC